MSTLNFDYSLKRRDPVNNVARLVDYEQVEESITNYSGLAFMNDVAYHASDTVELPMGNITKGTVLFIASSTPINVYIGDPAVVTAIKTKRIFIFGDSNQYFTEVHVGNNLTADTTADIEYFIGGDPETT